MRKLAYGLLVILLLMACRSSKQMVTTEKKQQAFPEVSCLTSRMQLLIPGKNGGQLSASGLMKMESNKRIRFSVLMPVLRTEVARIEITPEYMLLVDRMNKKFVRASMDRLKETLSVQTDYYKIEKMLLNAAESAGETDFTGRNLGLGIPMLANASIRFYDFSESETAVEPTELSSKYKQVPWEVLVEVLFEQL